MTSWGRNWSTFTRFCPGPTKAAAKAAPMASNRSEADTLRVWLHATSGSTPPATTPSHRPRATRSRCGHFLRGKVKRALVQPGRARFLASNIDTEHRFKHRFLEPPDDGVALEQIQNGRMILENVRTDAVDLADPELCHVAFVGAHWGEPFRAVGHGPDFYLVLERLRSSLEDIVEQFFRSVRAMNFVDRFQ